MDLLMERVREEAANTMSWSDLVQAAKNNLMDKQNCMDIKDREELKLCAAYIQQHNRVSTRKELLDQIRALANSCGLTVTVAGGSSFVSSEAFYVELRHAADVESAAVDAALVAHGTALQPSERVRRLVDAADWAAVAADLAGLLALYGDCPSDFKLRAFECLCAAEADLLRLNTIQSLPASVDSLQLLTAPHGILVERDGGRAASLLYFCAPNELLDLQLSDLRRLSSTAPSLHVGRNVSLGVAGAPQPTCLQSSSLLDARGAMAPLGSHNSASLPVAFCMRLDRPLILSDRYAVEIRNLTGLSPTCLKEGRLLPMLVESHSVWSQLIATRGDLLRVNLPGATHCYRFDTAQHNHLSGVLVEKVFFTNVAQVAALLEILRRQDLFNCAVESVVRAPADSQAPRVSLELSCPRHDRIDCLFEHPLEPNVWLQCSFRTTCPPEVTVLRCPRPEPFDHRLDDLATRVFSTSFSVAVTMRSVLRQIVRDGGADVHMPSAEEGCDGGGRNGPKDGAPPDTSSDQFCLPSAYPVSTKRSNAWSSSSAGSRSAVVVGRSFDNADLQRGRTPFDLLLSFREPRDWRELIPPQPNQPELKSPVPPPPPPPPAAQPLFQPHFQPAPHLQDMLFNPQSAMLTSAAAFEAQTPSPASSLAAQPPVLDSPVDRLPPAFMHDAASRPFAMSSSALSTPTSDCVAGPLGDAARRRSIQEAIDSVAKGEEAPSPSIFPYASAPPTGQAPPTPLSAHEQLVARRFSFGLGAPYDDGGGGGGGARPAARSIDMTDFAAMQHRQCDQYDFDASDPIEAGLLGEVPRTPGAFYAGIPEQFPFPANFPHVGQPPKSMRLAPGTQRARRSRARKGGNVGDREPSAPGEKKKRASTSSKPRKSRAAPSQLGDAAALQQGALPLPLAQVQQKPAAVALPTSYQQLTPFALPVETCPKLEPRAPASGLDMEELSERSSESSDDVDAKLRRQIQDLGQTLADSAAASHGQILPAACNEGHPYIKTEADCVFPSTHKNLFERMQECSSSATVPTTTTPSDDDLTSRLLDVAASRQKPSILSKSARKGSLDAVIGKLKDRMCDLYDDESKETPPNDAQRPSADDCAFDAPQSDVPNADPLKVVIRKHVQREPSYEEAKVQLSRQKSEPSKGCASTKDAQREKSQTVSARKRQAPAAAVALEKVKVQQKKRKLEQQKCGVEPGKWRAPPSKASRPDMPPGFPPIQSAMLPKSLKQFRIPKLVDDAPPPPTATAVVAEAVRAAAPPPPKSILKQTPPKPQPSVSGGSFRPMARRGALLPSPPADAAPRLTAAATRPLPVEAVALIDSPDDGIKSPDLEPSAHDDSAASPIALNTSKDSSDKSPELKIVDADSD